MSPDPIDINSTNIPDPESQEPKETTTEQPKMEVHHHTSIGNKNWKHVLFEFFMIFMAVFCGFLAEYKLEHVIEGEREKQYISSIIRDMSEDTKELATEIDVCQMLLNSYDSLLSLLPNIQPSQNANRIYHHFINTTYLSNFKPIDRTIQQLKNAGAMRMLRNIEASDSITLYYAQTDFYQVTQQIFKDYFDKFHDDAFRVFDYKLIAPYFDKPEDVLTLSNPIQLASHDPALLVPLFNKLFILRRILEFNQSELTKLETKALSTIAYLKKEYKLK